MAKQCKTSHKIINWPPCAAIQQILLRLNGNLEFGQKFVEPSQIWVNYRPASRVPQLWFRQVMTSKRRPADTGFFQVRYDSPALCKISGGQPVLTDAISIVFGCSIACYMAASSHSFPKRFMANITPEKTLRACSFLVQKTFQTKIH